MIFAAGFGTRMGDLVKDRPKPLLEVAGRPLIDHALALTEDINLSRIVVNTHYQAAVLEKHLASKDVEISREMPDILDTGGGLKAALPLLGPAPLFTLNSDAVWSGPNPLSLLQRAWDPARMDALVICVPLRQAVGRIGAGDFSLDDENRISRGPDVVYGGAQILKTGDLSDITDPVFSLNRVWDKMLARGRLFGLTYPGMWCDVGHPAGIQLAEELLARDAV